MCGCCSSNSMIDINKSNSITSNSLITIDRHSKTSDYKKKYKYISTIGNGSFGKVRLYIDRKLKSMKYAIKTIKKDFFNIHSIESVIREIEILRSLDHPNIVKYFETYEDDFFLHIVMEYIPGDNLFKMISNKKYIRFTEKDINEIFLFLMKAVSFLHHNGIVHRDIKPENILFSVPGKYSSLKLIDFGLSIPRNARKEKYRVGTPYYMAPEMIDGKYYYKSDMWSIAVILFIMVTGSLPFNGQTKNEVFTQITEGRYNKKKLNKQKCSKELKDLIKRALIIDPSQRISIEEALQHDWFKLFTTNTNEDVIISPDIIKALKDFQSQNILQKEVLYYLAKISSENEISKLKQAFSLIDKDNSGEIEYEEIPKIFQDLGIEASEEELKNIFDSLDFHNDGKVNYSEFIAATLSSVQFAEEERLISAFRYFDVTDCGYLTLDSVIEALKQNNVIVNEVELAKIFKDLNNQGKKIDFNEFKRIFYQTNKDHVT